MPDEQDKNEDTPGPVEPGPEKYPRTAKGHLVPEARERALADVLRAVQGGASSIKGISDLLGLARPTVRDMLVKLGVVAKPGNAHGPGALTLHGKGPETESPRAKARRKKREADAKKALKREAERIRKAAGAPPAKPSAPAPKPAPLQPEQAYMAPEQAPSAEAPPAPKEDDLLVLDEAAEPPDQPADLAGEEIPPVLDGGEPPDDPPKPKRRNGVAKGTPRDRLPGNPPPMDPTVDKVALVQIPAAFDEIHRLRQISICPWIDAGQQIAALRILVGVRSNKGKIDWSTVTPEQIPEEMRHRLAGMLLGWVDLAELPEQVRAAPLVCRQVYKLTGVLPGTVAAAEVVLERWAVLRAELRELAGEARVELGVKAPPLELSLAAETAYVAPQWDVN